MDNNYSPIISEESFAAWLDGTMSYEQESAFLKACSDDKDLQELLDANDQVEDDYEDMVEYGYELPYEFNRDFDIPQVEDLSVSDNLYSYDDIEPYEQDSEELDNSEKYDAVDSVDDISAENDSHSSMDAEMDFL